MINTIYKNLSQILTNKGYRPQLLTDNTNDIKILLFVSYTENIVFSVTFEKIENTLYLHEGALFKGRGDSNISCGFFQACSVDHENKESTNKLICRFYDTFDQFIDCGISFKIDDSNVIHPNMKSGIVFENPEYAIALFAKQNNFKLS